MMSIARTLSAAMLTVTLANAQSSERPDQIVSGILDSLKFKAARTYIEDDHDRIVREIIRLTEIPAPPFKEGQRARAYMDMLEQGGLVNVEMDEEGNVMGVRKGRGGGGMVAVAAHLDTVFPPGTDVTVKREGTRLMAPGVGDDTRNLAVLLAMIRAMDGAGIETSNDILFIGDVGEEGPGDLRGMKYLFQKGPYKGKIGMFISLDGVSEGRITNGALGSKRYRVTFKGPGGHSYGSFGLVSPAFALGSAVRKFSSMDAPKAPKTTFNVGVMGGGTSVNSIPFETWMDVDMRSESPEELNEMVAHFMTLMEEAVEEENNRRSTTEGEIELEIKRIGDRPSGETPESSRMVRLATASMEAFGLRPRYQIGSTDSNIPISLGIPAITIGSGGSGGRGHSLDEWIDVERTASVRGITIALTVLLSIAGFE